MANFMTVCKKELGDNLGSKRYLMLFALVIVLSGLSAYQGAMYLKNNASAGFMSIFSGSQFGFSFMSIMVFFGPIIGLALGFDAINKERTSGTLSMLLSQPIFRDSVLNGKFVAGIAALSLLATSTIGIMVGVAIPLLGFGPALGDILRIVLFTLLSILYLGFWLALSLLFSTAIKKTTTSILAAVFTWLFFVLIITIMASLVANAVAPVQLPQGFNQTGPGGNQTGPGGFNPFNQTQTPEYQQLIQTRARIQSTIQSISPAYLYDQAASSILGTESNTLGFITGGQGTPFRTQGLSQGLSASWPQVTAIAVGLVACFVAAYMLFLRREIRPGG
jgi:ABC-2 type transport system permease protein